MKKLLFFLSLIFLVCSQSSAQTAYFTGSGAPVSHTNYYKWDFVGDPYSCGCRHIWEFTVKGSPYCSDLNVIDSTAGCVVIFKIPSDCEYTYFKVKHTVCCPNEDCTEWEEEYGPYSGRPVLDEIVARASSIKNNVAIFNNPESSIVVVNLLDASGRLLFHREVLPFSTAEYPLTETQKGVYIMQAIINGKKQVVKLVNQ